MKIWYQNNSKLSTFIFEKGTRDRIKPLIVLANSKGIFDIKNAPSEIKNCTIRVDQLISYIKRDLEKYDKDIYYKRGAMEEIAEGFLKRHVELNSNFDIRYTFITNEELAITNVDNFQNINNVTINPRKEELSNKLIEFRNERAKQNHIPAFYVFTDKELEDIIEANIKTLDELRDSKILPEVKVRLHGQEIINVINNISN